jgi:hypothetical protein
MFNLDKELETFSKNCEEFKNKKFENFEEYEKECCTLINAGNSIRKYILQNKECCDEASYQILSNNRDYDVSLLGDKFKCLLNAAYLFQNLVKKYKERTVELKEEQKFEDLVNVYEQLFKLTYDAHFKIKSANILFKIFNNVDESFKRYVDSLEALGSEADFWWQFSDIYKAQNDIFNQVLCYKKALDIEIKNKEGSNG